MPLLGEGWRAVGIEPKAPGSTNTSNAVSTHKGNTHKWILVAEQEPPAQEDVSYWKGAIKHVGTWSCSACGATCRGQYQEPGAYDIWFFTLGDKERELAGHEIPACTGR